MVNKIPVAFFLALLTISALAQTGTIKGVVLNVRTYERLPHASVYINYTTLGTMADEKGEFILRNVPLGQHELIVSFVGHHHSQTKIVVKDTSSISITIRLLAKELKEVTVYSKRDKKWDRQLEKFKKLFLGNSIHAAGCEILNPWILDFSTDKNGFFKATSSDILQIENYSLGYELFYQLKNFLIGSSEFLIRGNVRFKLMETSDTATANQWMRNRLQVYMGSSRHLFKSIIERSLTNEGFELYRDNTNAGDIIRMANFLANVGHEITDYTIEDLIYDESIPAQYKIQFPQRLEVHYLNKSDDPRIYRNVTHPVSWIEVSEDYLIINSQGIVLNPTNMTMSGNMIEARIAELLPYDFHAPKTKMSLKTSFA